MLLEFSGISVDWFVHVFGKFNNSQIFRELSRAFSVPPVSKFKNFLVKWKRLICLARKRGILWRETTLIPRQKNTVRTYRDGEIYEVLSGMAYHQFI